MEPGHTGAAVPLVCNVTQWAHRMRCICGGMRGVGGRTTSYHHTVSWCAASLSRWAVILVMWIFFYHK